jgi:AraC-like DNA-binding protein
LGMENWKEIVLLLAAGQGILLALALLTRFQKQDRSNIFLSLIILIVSLELLNDWGIQVGYHQSDNAFPFWLLGSYLVMPASLWLFAEANAKRDFIFSRKKLWLYVPAFIEIATEATNFYRYRLTGKSINLLDIKAWFFFTEILPVLGMIAALVFYAMSFKSFFRTDNAASTSRIFKTKMVGLFIVFLLLTVCWIGEVFIHLPIFGIVEIMLISFLFIMGYIGYARPVFFDIPARPGKKSSKAQVFASYDDQKELNRLTGLLEEKSLYTRPGLTLEELSGELELPVRYVSYLINSYHATNFHHFVNTYRVKEVIRKISDPREKHKTLLALAMESGFNSKSAFNQVFKTHTGKSPSEYLK